jgi:hypothetical protein
MVYNHCVCGYHVNFEFDGKWRGLMFFESIQTLTTTVLSLSEWVCYAFYYLVEAVNEFNTLRQILLRIEETSTL